MTPNTINLSVLQKLELFKNLNSQQLEQISTYLQVETYKKNEIIIDMGEPGTHLFIIVQGTVMIFRSRNEESVMTFRFHANDIFGEIALIEDIPRTARVQAETDVICYTLSRQKFQAIFEQYPQVAFSVLQRVTKRMRLSADAYSEKLQKKNAELQRIYNQLQKAHQELKALDKEKSRFIKLISHELLTPVNVFSSAVQLMKRKNTDKALNKYTDMLTAKCSRLTNQIQQIVTLSEDSTYDLGNIPLEETELHSLIEDFTKEFSPFFKERNLHFTSETKEIPASFFCIPYRFRQIIDELFYNAIRFTDDGGTIVLRMYQDAGALVLECEDSGIGIDSKLIPSIFHPFVEGIPIELHSSGELTFMSSGMGVGLAIVWNNVIIHHGRIWVHTVFKQGTLIRIAFPLSNKEAVKKLHYPEMQEIVV